MNEHQGRECLHSPPHTEDLKLHPMWVINRKNKCKIAIRHKTAKRWGTAGKAELDTNVVRTEDGGNIYIYIKSVMH